MWTKLKTWLLIGVALIGTLPTGGLLCFGVGGHFEFESSCAEDCHQTQSSSGQPAIGSVSTCFDLLIPGKVTDHLLAGKTIDIPSPAPGFLPVILTERPVKSLLEPIHYISTGDLAAFRETVILLN